MNYSALRPHFCQAGCRDPKAWSGRSPSSPVSGHSHLYSPTASYSMQLSASRGRNDGRAFLPASRTLHPASLWERAGSPGSHVSMATRMLACQWSRTHTALRKDGGLSPEWSWSGSLDNAQGLAQIAKSPPACWPVPTQQLLAKGKPAHLESRHLEPWKDGCGEQRVLRS